MKNILFLIFTTTIILISGTFSKAISQNNHNSLERLYESLDSIEFLQQEAIRSGNSTNEYYAEIKQLQTAIKIRSNKLKDKFKPNDKSDLFKQHIFEDSLIIIIGIIASAAFIFLIVLFIKKKYNS